MVLFLHFLAKALLLLELSHILSHYKPQTINLSFTINQNKVLHNYEVNGTKCIAIKL